MKFKKKQQTKIYLKYNLTLLLTIVLPLSFIGFLNFIVDPYGVFNTPIIYKLNYIKPELDKHQRLVKSADIINYKPKKVLLGSSTVLNGLNPRKIDIFFRDRDLAYNLGISSINMKETRLYFDHLLLNQPKLNTVILGLNFFMFNNNKNNNLLIKDNVILKKNGYLNLII